MKTHLLCAGLMTLLVVAPNVQAQERKIRAGAEAIPTLVLPSDKEVVIEGSSDAPLVIRPADGTPLAEWLADQSDLVAVIRVNSKKSMLVGNNRWIESRVMTIVEELLKSPTDLNIQQGDQLVFVEQGGAIDVGQARVRAVLPWMEPTKVGGRYLVFTERVNPGEFPLVPSSTYELVRSIPRKLVRGAPDDAISASTEEDVVGSLQRFRIRQ